MQSTPKDDRAVAQLGEDLRAGSPREAERRQTEVLSATQQAQLAQNFSGDLHQQPHSMPTSAGDQKEAAGADPTSPQGSGANQEDANKIKEEE